MDYIASWIILIIFGLVIFGLLIWRFCISNKSFYNSMEEEVIDHKPVAEEHRLPQVNQSHEIMDTHWIEDIDDLHMTKVVKKKNPKDTIDGIGHPQRKM
jgi:adenine deaminase